MYRCPYFCRMRNSNIIQEYGGNTTPKKNFTTEEALWICKYLNIKFDKFDLNQFRIGLDVELEHGRINPFTNITNDDPIITGKITLAHLNEYPDYYKRLTKMEEEAEKYWEHKD